MPVAGAALGVVVVMTVSILLVTTGRQGVGLAELR
jgi:hypothetical protein